jgi:hypothetical protein
MTTRITNQTGRGTRVNSDREGRPTEDEREYLYSRFWDLYQNGLSDLKIAEETGVCDRTVRRWRFRLDLPNIYGRRPTYGG